MKKIIGIMMIAIPFILLFIGHALSMGIKNAILGTLGLIGLFVWVMIAIYLVV